MRLITRDTWIVEDSELLESIYAVLGVNDPEEGNRAHHDVAGLLRSYTGRPPAVGDRVTVGPVTFEVLGFRSHSGARVLVRKVTAGG